MVPVLMSEMLLEVEVFREFWKMESTLFLPAEEVEVQDLEVLLMDMGVMEEVFQEERQVHQPDVSCHIR